MMLEEQARAAPVAAMTAHRSVATPRRFCFPEQQPEEEDAAVRTSVTSVVFLLYLLFFRVLHCHPIPMATAGSVDEGEIVWVYFFLPPHC